MASHFNSGRAEARFDAVVVGAGPAGATAAWHLARNGASVLLLEKKAWPRYKTCGGGIVERVFGELPECVNAAVERLCYSAELRVARTALSFTTRREHPIVRMTMRATLDAALVAEAERHGAVVLSESAVTGLRWDEAGIEVLTAGGSIRARFAIGADGVNSAVARHAGWEAVDRVPAVEWEVRTGEAGFAITGGAVRFDLHWVPQGYGWVFPKRDHLSMGVLTFRNGKVPLERAMEEYLRALGLSAVSQVERHGWMIPVRPRRGRLARDRIVLVGDAAGLADPVTLEGITYAARSGRLAAEALVEGKFDPAKACRIFNDRMRETILDELRWARLFSAVLYGRPGLTRQVFQRFGRALSERMTDVVSGRLSYRELGREVLTSLPKAMLAWKRAGSKRSEASPR